MKSILMQHMFNREFFYRDENCETCPCRYDLNENELEDKYQLTTRVEIFGFRFHDIVLS